MSCETFNLLVAANFVGFFDPLSMYWNVSKIYSGNKVNLWSEFHSNCVEYSPSYKANSLSASQETPRVLYMPKVHFCQKLNFPTNVRKNFSLFNQNPF